MISDAEKKAIDAAMTAGDFKAAIRLALGAGATPSPWSMTEAVLLAEVTALCEQHGVVPIHISTPHHNKGRHLIGFPDLLLVGRRIAFRELKSMNGMLPGHGLRPEQTTWKNRLLAAGQDWSIWTPRDLLDGTVKREITELSQPTRTAP